MRQLLAEFPAMPVSRPGGGGLMTIPKDALKQIEYYATALKALRIRNSAARLADQARDAG